MDSMSSVFPRVAVLLAAYNGMEWIEEQLDSVLNQANVNVSVFISVDPSTDGTESWCADYAHLHANVTLLPPAGRFGGASRNFFRLVKDVDFSLFDYVAFADQDDIWHPDKLDRATTKLRSEVVDAYSSNVTAFWPNGHRLLIDKAQPQVRWDHFFEAAGPGCTYVLNRRLADALKASLLEQWRAAQNVTLHDWYCYAFARNQGFRWFIDPAPSMDYRQHADNQIGANTGIKSRLSRLTTVLNGWWGTQVLLIKTLTEKNTPENANHRTSKRYFFFRFLFRPTQCRRRKRDQFFFIIVCLATIIGG